MKEGASLCELKNFSEVDNIIIFGCGGHARSVINVIRKMSEGVKIFLVDENARENESILECRVVRQYEMKENDAYIIAIGDNAKRRAVYNSLVEEGSGHSVSIISVDSNIGMRAKIGQGTFVGINAYIGPQAEIGSNTIINTGSVIEHEVKIGNHTHIAPSATVCGRTRIGNNVFCGVGSIVIDNIEICDNVVIGAGAVVINNIVESGTYVGVPAKRIS